MIYNFVDFFLDPIMWFLFSKEGSEWVPTILLILGILAISFLIYSQMPRRGE